MQKKKLERKTNLNKEFKKKMKWAVQPISTTSAKCLQKKDSYSFTSFLVDYFKKVEACLMLT